MQGTVRLRIEDEGVASSRMWIIPRDEIREVEFDGAHACVMWNLKGDRSMYRVEFYLGDDACPQMAQLFYLYLIEHESDDLIIGSKDCKEWRLNGNPLNEWLLSDNDPKDLSEYLKQGS